MKNNELAKKLLELRNTNFDVMLAVGENIYPIEDVEVSDFKYVGKYPESGRITQIVLMSKCYIKNRKNRKVVELLQGLDEEKLDILLSLDLFKKGL